MDKDMDNNNKNNRFISPNRIGRSLYDDNESITNSIDNTKTLQNDQINKENFGRKYNNAENKNTARPEVAINQYLEKSKGLSK